MWTISPATLSSSIVVVDPMTAEPRESNRTSLLGSKPVIELGHVTERKPPFHFSAFARVAFSDTDAQGVVYYGRYLPYFDLARVEYHRHLGRPHVGNVDFAMRAITVEYV